jgi:hypothetical protein
MPASGRGNERIVKYSLDATDHCVYRAPVIFVAGFYLLLLTWTIVCVSLIGLRADRWGWENLPSLLMIAFILAYTWYFSAAIAYQIGVGDDRRIRLTSFRRIIEADVAKITLVEGPHLPVGFLRLRLEREKAYLFCVIGDAAFKRTLAAIRAANPQARFRRLPSL